MSTFILLIVVISDFLPMLGLDHTSAFSVTDTYTAGKTTTENDRSYYTFYQSPSIKRSNKFD